MAYAARTQVTVEQTQSEIRRLLEKAGAAGWALIESPDGRRAAVQFMLDERTLRFELPLPPVEQFAYGKARSKYDPPPRRTQAQAAAAQQQAVRSLWRALLLTVKAKLESVASGIETLEEAFMAAIVLPDQTTVGQNVLPRVAEAYAAGEVPQLLPPPRPALPAPSAA